MARARRAVGLDGVLVVELAVERGRARRDRLRALVQQAVPGRVAVLAVGVDEPGDPHVATLLERLLGVRRALRAHERSTLAVPGDDRVARVERPDVGERGE